MANAQLMQEELQQSVVLSEEDAEFEVDIANDTMMVDNDVPASAGHASESVPPPYVPQGHPKVGQAEVDEEADEDQVESDAHIELVEDAVPQEEKDDGTTPARIQVEYGERERQNHIAPKY